MYEYIKYMEDIEMSFGNNLRMVRKEKGLTQEHLAELLDVSRQAVSKWESGTGYPETDKLLVIAKELDVSLDFLMGIKPKIQGEEIDQTYVPTGEKRIIITMFDGSQIVNCLSIKYSKIVFPAKNEPAYILEGIDKIGFFGAHSVILGWYENEEMVKKEMSEIIDAMDNDVKMYQLKYFTDIKFTMFGSATRK